MCFKNRHKKAFDTISWEFIITGLKAILVYSFMVRWIEVYISTTHFLVAMSGELHRFFPSSRGLQQGDPLSSYLFVLVV
jgi:hypothetical protein